MRLQKVTMLILMVNFIVLSGCSSSSPVEGVKGILNDYKTMQLTVEKYNRLEDLSLITDNFEAIIAFHKEFETYLTQSSYEKFVANRQAIIPLLSSFNGKHTSTVERITVTEVKEDKESGSITLRYEVSVTFKFINTNEEKRITDVGEARFINEDGVWKIENDWYDWDQEYFKT